MNNRGQMLIEALVALSIFLIALTAITVTVVTAVSNSRFAQDQNAANKYAQAGIEQIKNRGYTSVKNLTGTWAMGDNNALVSLPSTPVNIEQKYKRDATFTPGIPGGVCAGGIRVEVIVKWNSPKCQASNTFCHQSKQTTCMTQAGY